MFNVDIRTIDHSEQRYDTVGDWQWIDNEHLVIYVSFLDSWQYEYLIAQHELVEAVLCKNRGISEKQVDEFDKQFEIERLEKKHPENAEPGFDSRAPYYREHIEATLIEGQMCVALGQNWSFYENSVCNL